MKTNKNSRFRDKLLLAGRAILFLFSSLIISLPLQAADAGEKPLRNFQLSLLPFLGSDGTAVIQYRYQVSFNLFAGINGGVEGIELGGFANINTGPVNGFQAAGFANVVSGDFQGFQGAGFANINRRSVQGFAGAGFMNLSGQMVQGIQGAGFANISGGSMQGISGAGFANISGGSQEGISGAGFANIAGGHFRGLTGAGFINVAGGNSQGLMGAGFANINGGDFKGAQLAGFLNVARAVEGLQLGFINVADTIDGVPLGFISFVKRGGLRQIELSASDGLYMQASFKMGVPVFYNIFSMGFRPHSGSDMLRGLGYGVGSRIALSEYLAMNIELHSTAVDYEMKWPRSDADRLNELRVGLAAGGQSRFEFFAAAVLYNHWQKGQQQGEMSRIQLAPYVLHESQWDSGLVSWWAGARAGVRINLN